MSVYAPERKLIASINKLPPNSSELNKMLYLEQKHFLPDHNLNYTDKVSMAYGVEVRVPLLDPELISHVVPLPDKFKQREDWEVDFQKSHGTISPKRRYL